MMESGGGQIRDRGAHVMSCAMWWMGADGTGPVTVEATGPSAGAACGIRPSR
jgi:predicted dehydrogenase